jgi:hypothetical protein
LKFSVVTHGSKEPYSSENPLHQRLACIQSGIRSRVAVLLLP